MGQIERAPAPNVSRWPVFVGRMTGIMVGGGFVRLPLLVVTDTHGRFDQATNLYTIPETGVYRLEMKVRYLDNTPGGLSIGVGAGTAEIDDDAFLWGTTATVAGGKQARNGLVNQRIMQLAAGDQIRLYSYCDDSVARRAEGGELTIDRMR